MTKSRAETYRRITFIVLAILVITFLHYYTNIWLHTFHAVYRLLYYIPIIMAAFSFGMRGSVITSLSVSALYLPQVFLYFSYSHSAGVDSLLEVLLYNIIAILTGSLIEVEKKQKAELLSVSEELRLSNIELQKNIDAIEALQNYTNCIVQSVSDGIVAVNDKRVITLMNKSAEEMLKATGYPTALGETFPLFAKEIEGVIEQKGPFSFQQRVQLNKEAHPFQLKISSLYSADEKKIGAVLTMNDLYKLETLQESLRRSERLASLGQLTAGIAHEIRNPLGIIKATTQLIQDEVEKQNEDIARSFDIILEEIERIEKRITEFLNYAKPSNYNKESFNPNELVQDIIESLHTYLAQSDIEVKLHLSPGKTMLLGDFEKLRQAFTNIILNAVQAMPQGGKLQVATESDDNSFTFIFSDSGIGIEPDKLSSIFNPFFTTKDSGTGLGLPIAHRIIEDHHGTIDVKSAPGEGTTFTIILPAVKEE